MKQRTWSAVAVTTTLLASVMIVAPTPVTAAGSVSVTTLGALYSQDFDSLATTATSSTVPLGWDFAEAGTNANGLYAAGTGSSNAGDTYSLGAAASTERALGGLLSGSLVPTVGAQFTNDSGATISSLDIAYTGEMWRSGAASRTAPDRIDFQISTDATSLVTGTWVDHDPLDFSSPTVTAVAGAIDGNVAANRTALASTIDGLAIADGATFWIRWTDVNVALADDALAIDDFSLTAFGDGTDAAPAVESTTPADGATDVAFAADVSVTFTEPVNATAASFDLACTTSGAHPFALSGGPSTYTLDPDTDFAEAESCTLTVAAAAVTDQDAVDPPDTMAADEVVSFSTVAPDSAPEVSSTVPADGATDVPIAQNITVTFSEPVDVTDPWYAIECSTSGAHSATVSGGPTTFTLDPNPDFAYGESCTLTIEADNVSDQDGNDPPDTLTVDFTAGFSAQPDPCAAAVTPVPTIQGSGPTAAVTGTVTTRGVVVSDDEGPSPALRGFYLQDPDGDGDPATSDGIFVFRGDADDVSNGDTVTVTGTAAEFQGQTQISASSVTVCGTGATLAPTDVIFPVASTTFLEQYEGMLVRLPQEMTVTEHFQLGRFGQVVLSQGGRLLQPTNEVEPGAAANAMQAANNLRKIILDDSSQGQNPDPIVFGRGGQPLSATNTLRGGDTATGIVGVMTFTWAGSSASGNAYRVRPLNALGGAVEFQAANPRPASAPDVGGDLQVVGMNLLNFFNTFADSNSGTPGCFPSGGDSDCRGANSQQEYDRQAAKTVAAILALDPEVLGVNEIENDGYGPTSVLQALVDLLNEATAPGTYAFIDVDAATGQPNAMGTDAIKVAQIYQPGVVTPLGAAAALNSVEFVNGGDASPRNRPSLAQAYTVNASGAVFVVDVNHLKSKGSACSAPDAGDGQGNCNQVRVNSATALMDWLATDPTGSGDPDVVMVGDYNSYAREDPIDVIENAGYSNLIEEFVGEDAYSYVFDGQWGYLDHAFGSPSIVSQITGVADYHINSDEPSVLDYNTNFKSAGQIDSLYAADEFRVSDHDPVIIGITPNDGPTVDAGGPYSVSEGSTVTLSATGTDPNGDALSYAWDLDDDGTFETAGQSVEFDAATLDGPDSRSVAVQATDDNGAATTDTATVDITNAAPSVQARFASDTVRCGTNNSRLLVSFDDPGLDDTHSVSVAWGDGSTTVVGTTSPVWIAHTYRRAGVYTATATVTDDDGGVGTASASVTVDYGVTIRQPLNANGSSVFRARGIVPVRLLIVECNRVLPPDLAPTISVSLLSSSTPRGVNERSYLGTADTSGVMRFVNGQYEYHLSTDLPDRSASYRIVVTVPATGQQITVRFGLRP